MLEFLVRPLDAPCFDLPTEGYEDVLRPSSFDSRPIHGGDVLRIEVSGAVISFSVEDPGVQVAFESGAISEEVGRRLGEEIAGNITAATGQRSEVLLLSR
jgi:hypothetical protein